MLKVVTIGGGSSYTPELIEGFIKRHSTFPVTEIWLVDIEEGREKQEIVADLARRMVKKAGVDIKIFDTLDRKLALKDADFVTTQFRVGLLDARIIDEKIPLSHGELGQETNGAGGLFKALRTIPIIFDIIDDVNEVCPNAWIINFTNPAGIVTEAVHRYKKFKKFIGLCNVPYGMKMVVSEVLEKEYNDFEMTFAGLNHMVYGISVKVDGKEVISDVIDKASRSNVKNVADLPFNEVFLKEMNLILCPYHRYYYKRSVMLEHELDDFNNKNGLTRATFVKGVEKELFEIYKQVELNEKPKQLENRGGAHYSDAACNLINSLYNDLGDIQVVNTVNNGAISDFYDDEVVEISSVITKNGPVPVRVGSLPVAITGLLRQIKSFEKLAAEAAATKDLDKAYLALCINPLTSNDEVARTVFDELVEAHSKYLNGYK